MLGKSGDELSVKKSGDLLQRLKLIDVSQVSIFGEAVKSRPPTRSHRDTGTSLPPPGSNRTTRAPSGGWSRMVPGRGLPAGDQVAAAASKMSRLPGPTRVRTASAL